MAKEVTSPDQAQQIVTAEPGRIDIRLHSDPEELLACDDCTWTAITDPAELIIQEEESSEE